MNWPTTSADRRMQGADLVEGQPLHRMTVLTRAVRRLQPVDTEGSTPGSPGPLRSENRAVFRAVGVTVREKPLWVGTAARAAATYRFLRSVVHAARSSRSDRPCHQTDRLLEPARTPRSIGCAGAPVLSGAASTPPPAFPAAEIRQNLGTRAHHVTDIQHQPPPVSHARSAARTRADGQSCVSPRSRSKEMCGDSARRKSGASKAAPAEVTPAVRVRPVRMRWTASTARGAVTA